MVCLNALYGFFLKLMKYMYRYIDNLILISTKTHVSSSTVIISNVPENSLLRPNGVLLVVCGSCTRRSCNKRDRFLCERKKEKKKISEYTPMNETPPNNDISSEESSCERVARG